MKTNWYLCLPITVFLIIGTVYTQAAEYRYKHSGGEVVLQSSSRLIYVEEDPSSAVSFAEAASGSLKRHRLSDHYSMKKRGAVYERVPVKKGSVPDVGMHHITASAAQTVGAEWQPVFEQGMAILIPTDRVIVGFKEAAAVSAAAEYLQQQASAIGILTVAQHRKNSFIVTIDKPSGGRAFEAAAALSELSGIEFAEPDFRFIINDQQPKEPEVIKKPRLMSAPAASPAEETAAPAKTVLAVSSPTWVTIDSLDFESGTGGWSSSSQTNATTAAWGVTTYRSHSGSSSLYCAQTLSSAPGPYANNMYAWFSSPSYNLSPYEEVYLEAWFYTVHEAEYYPEYGYAFAWDYPMLALFQGAYGIVASRLVTGYTGDLTADATTQNGWRKVLYRVPAAYLGSDASFAFIFSSDYIVSEEGTYIDDIRIVATADVDTDPLGNDTYAARHWSHRNVGQIAGLGDDDNDLHVTEAWDLTAVSTNVVVAVIDSGVDLTHPDLNLVTGYDFDGSIGGGPRGSHGTACAGEVGAIRNNGIGVIGTAPGVKLMPIYMGNTNSHIASSIDVAVGNGAHVLSCSWGAVDWFSSDIEDAIDDAIAAGCIVLFAAGNGPDRYPWTYEVAFPGSMAASRDMLCIGGASPTDEHKSASSSDGEFTWGASYIGDGPDVTASTTWSYTTDWQGTNGYNTSSAFSGIDEAYTHDFTGTSAATPKAAGIAALMLSADSSLTPAEIKATLIATADDIEDAGTDEKTGAGRINAYMAVLAAIGSPVENIAVTTSGSDIILHFTGNAYGEFTLLSTSSLIEPNWLAETNLTLDGAGGAAFNDTADSSVRFYTTD